MTTTFQRARVSINFAAALLILAPALVQADAAERKRGVAVTAPAQALAVPALQGTNAVEDGGFEGGSPSAAWNEFSSNFGTPLCTVPSCGVGGGTGPLAGAWWAWFGGISGVEETGSVDQDLAIPVGETTLGFSLEIPVADATGFLEVSIDDTVLFSVTETNQPQYGTYTDVAVDISAFADGGTHNLKFNSTTDAGAGPLNFFVDNVFIGQCALALQLPEPQIKAGSVLEFAIHLRHQRVDTVTTPFQTWVEDAAGRRSLESETQPVTMSYGDELHRSGAVRIPSNYRPGVYFLVVGIDQMQQGYAVHRKPFRVEMN